MWFLVALGCLRLDSRNFVNRRSLVRFQLLAPDCKGTWSRTEDRACGDDVDRAFECSVGSRLFSEVSVDVEERIDAFKQSRFDFVRRAINDV